jgi:hypothetical protein
MMKFSASTLITDIRERQKAHISDAPEVLVRGRPDKEMVLLLTSGASPNSLRG